MIVNLTTYTTKPNLNGVLGETERTIKLALSTIVIAQLMYEKLVYFVTIKLLVQKNISIKVLVLHECFTVNANETSIPFYGENSTGIFNEAFRINKIITKTSVRFFSIDQSVSKLNIIAK